VQPRGDWLANNLGKMGSETLADHVQGKVVFHGNWPWVEQGGYPVFSDCSFEHPLAALH